MRWGAMTWNASSGRRCSAESPPRPQFGGCVAAVIGRRPGASMARPGPAGGLYADRPRMPP